MNELTLRGCTSTPLAGYLKALALLRLVSAIDPPARGLWRGRTFVLLTSLDQEELEDYLLHRYQPSPVLAPWNGGSGFYDKDNKEALQTILAGTDPRLAAYRRSLVVAESVMAGVDRSASPKDAAKADLLVRLRGALPDEALDWLDAAVLISGEELRYPPLLGTGGNDGRLDFTNNFMQRVLEVLPESREVASQQSRRWLVQALCAVPAPGLLKKAIGQFAPGQVGGPNASNGFSAESLVNPWDFVLMIEGVLPFAAAAVRRNADDPEGVLSYPFTVKPVGAGSGSVADGDAGAARGEVWVPLWHRQASYREVRGLMAEGRAALGKRPARDALDFVRAVHTLGTYRGIQRFERYGFLMRSGKAYLATPLAQVTVREGAGTPLIDELDRDDWLGRFRRFAQGETIAASVRSLRRRLEDALFGLAAGAARPSDVQAVLVLLADAQVAIATSRKAREAGLRPVPRLSDAWVTAADDGSPEFRIACAVAGVGMEGSPALPLRAQFFPVHPHRQEWLDAASEATGYRRLHTPQVPQLVPTLTSLLQRRLCLADHLKVSGSRVLDSPSGIDLDDLAGFLEGRVSDTRIRRLLPALTLCDLPKDADHGRGSARIAAGFALVRTCLLPGPILQRLGVLPSGGHVSPPNGLVAQLTAGSRGHRVVYAAWRRLHVAGVTLLPTRENIPELGQTGPARVAAALMLPLRFGAAAALVRSITRTNDRVVASPSQERDE